MSDEDWFGLPQRPPAETTHGVPLSRIDPLALFNRDRDALRAAGNQRIAASAGLFDRSRVAESYPLVFRHADRVLRYSYLPATGVSRGVIVRFHGHDADLHLGPDGPLEDFDILAPWDTFGWRRQGSWFWGERGDGFVERLVLDLIGQHRQRHPAPPWFCTGHSMGGFAALYHGIRQHCDGVYVSAPQVDLRAKCRDYGWPDQRDNPYGYLAGDDLDTVPDLLAIAAADPELPPLYLVQNQFDAVNLFAEHGQRLVDEYHRKQAWCGLRVAPAGGHFSDASFAEACWYFRQLLDKAPPRRAAVTPFTDS